MLLARPYAWLAAGLCLAPLAYGQTWEQQGPLPTGLEIYDVQMLSRDEAWIAGNPGVLYHTTDGGFTWTERQLNTDSLWAVRFLGGLGIAAGNHIFRSSDGGQTWSQVAITGSIYQVQILDALHVYACGNGGSTYRSSDGGLTWSAAAVSDTVNTLLGIHFVSPQVGWTVQNNGRIYQTIDGGQTWTLNYSGSAGFSTIWFVDANEGWATGESGWLHTINGGQSWTRLGLTGPAGTHFTFHLDRSRSWAVGEGGKILATDDGWQTSTVQVPAGSERRLWAVWMTDAQNGLAVGEGGRIFATGDGGAHWQARHSGGSEVHGMDATDYAHAWAASAFGNVAFTANGGAFWETVVVDGFSVYGTVEDVDFLDDHLTGWATGLERAFGGNSGVIARSSDGGRTWREQFTALDHFLQDVAAVDANTAVAGGAFAPFIGGVILRTGDGGASWSYSMYGGPSIESIDMVDPLRGYAAGGAILRTDDGGQSWQTQYVPQYLLSDISFADRQNGWAVGGLGTLLHTTDGGQTWVSQAPGWLGFEALRAVHALDSQTCWIAGGTNVVARTRDGGRTWTRDSLPGGPSYRVWEALAMVDDAYGWAGTTGGNAGGPWRRIGPAMPPGYLHHERLARGRSVAFTVEGLSAGDVVDYYYSLTGIGQGPCQGGQCLGLLPPVNFFGRSTAAGGSAVLQRTVPPGAPFTVAHVQAVVTRGAARAATNTTSSPIEP